MQDIVILQDIGYLIFAETEGSKIDNNEFVSTALLDQSKAFDDILYQKLSSLDFERSTLQLIQEFTHQQF